jgi:predicted component of type VI protein secretion system
VRVEPSPGGTAASPPQRTESLARELVRSLLGAGAAPTLEIERGPAAGATRALPPPESALVIGRGDDAGWVLLDEDLSRTHAEVRRGWDGVTIRDLGSKNGTIVDGAMVDGAGVMLRDGARIELGNVVLRFRDPAERHLRGEPAGAGAAGAAGAAETAERSKAAGAKTAGAGVAAKVAAEAARAAAGATRAGVGATRAAAGSAAGAAVPPLWVAVGAFTLAGLALAGLVWVLAS